MENFTNLAKEIDCQGAQEAQKVPKKLYPRRNTPKHIIITLSKIKDKERIWKAAREKNTVTYKWVPISLSADFSKETLQARRGWKEVVKGKDLHPSSPYPRKLSFRMEGQLKCFQDKVKLKGFIITKQCAGAGGQASGLGWAWALSANNHEEENKRTYYMKC